MADQAGSPELYQEEEDQVEHVDIGDEELEDIIDEEEEDVAGEGDVEEEDEKPEEVEEVEEEEDIEEAEDEEGQEGLDLDIAEEEDGMGYHDEHDDDGAGYHDEDGGIGYQDEPYGGKPAEEDEEEDGGGKGGLDVDVDVEDAHHKSSHGAEEEVYQAEKIDMEADVDKEAALVHEENVRVEEKEQVEEKMEENKDDPLSRPPHGSEVFIGGITKDTVEDDLKELCASCGDIYEVRVMRDKEKGDNKGFAFVTFTNKESAEKAIETLNERELKGRKLRFSSSQAKNKLFIGNVPKNWDKEELQRVLLERAPGIINMELLMDPQNTDRNRGFAFVEYYNHGCAENARRQLSVPGFKLGTNSPTINWADTRGSTDNAAMSQVKVVYVRNLPDSATQEQLWKLFEPHGEISKVVLPQSKPGQPKRDFGFVHYADRSSALKAIEKTEKYVLEGRELEASLAKPPSEKRPGALYAPFGAGLLPQLYQSRAGYGYPDSDMYGFMDSGFGLNRGYGQPVIYGRGPAPAGMAMVPMMLPDGRMGYVLQQPGVQQGMATPHRDNRGAGRGSQSQRQSGGSSGGSSRRYRPY